MEPGDVVYRIYADDIIFYTIPTRKDPTKTALLGLSHFNQTKKAAQVLRQPAAAPEAAPATWEQKLTIRLPEPAPPGSTTPW